MGGLSDWQHALTKLFEVKKIGNLLEFGLGEGTRFLAENCGYVTSAEIVPAGLIGRVWFEKVEAMRLPNWEGFYQEAKESEMTPELKGYIENLFEKKQYDMAFVDSGVHYRGDITNLCLQKKIPIVAAHDTHGNASIKAYGWDIVKMPEDYKRVDFGAGEGTTFWIKDRKVYLKLMESL